LLWLAAALLVQGTVMHYAIVRGAEPSLVLVAVVWFSMRAGVERAALYGLLAGVGEDIIAFDPGGAWTFATAAAAIGAALPAREFFVDSIPFFAIVTFCVTLLRALVFWSIKKVEGFPPGLGTIHFHEALLQGVLNALLATGVALLARRFERARPAKRR
jgi:rod shape-determining protein MreD